MLHVNTGTQTGQNFQPYSFAQCAYMGIKVRTVKLQYIMILNIYSWVHTVLLNLKIRSKT